MTVDPDDVRRNVEQVRNDIADAGGDPSAVTVMAVTKGFPAGAVRAAVAAGLGLVGENYAQELLDKQAELVDVGADWHFIGRLQSNKVRVLADRIACWQSVDRPSLVTEIARRAPGARIMVQVNATGERAKGGTTASEAPALVAAARDAGLDVVGLMTVGILGDESATETAFRDVALLADRLGLEQRSMGMTGDLAAAVRAGTTMVRVGTALFGPRPVR